MQSRLLNESDGGLRTFAVIFDKGDEPKSGLEEFAREHDVDGASLTAIGAFQEATLAYFHPDAFEYRDIPIAQQVEVLSLVGDIALNDGEPEVHAHVVVGREDGTTAGGHLKAASVWPTLEVVVTETPSHLQKTVDEETGLALIDLDA
ncbi:MAG: PPC domain-containing DNA-binding protein [Nitriliruptorales bacterium]|nr:PPC domain-containing DNA-binding protein [Nitriliruptorales bacterium]